MPDSRPDSGIDVVALPFLTANVRYRVGRLELEAAFELTQPWTVLYGPSGAGKSTLLRILAGLVRPDTGALKLAGRTVVDTGVFVAAGKRKIGFLSQEPALFPHLDVRSNVGFGLHGMPGPERDSRVDHMLRLFQAGALGDRLPASLSGGERQRVALARALAPEPNLLLLDEPFAAFDPALKEGILADLLPWLRQRGIPVLYVSHDLAEALQTGSEVIALHAGKITAQGPAVVVLAEERQNLLRRLGV